MNTVWFALACLAVLAVCWVIGVDALRDSGGYIETGKSWWAEIRDRGHAFYHVVGAALTMLVGVVVFRTGPWDAAMVTFVAWLLVEVAQRYPRVPYSHGKPGRFSGFDLLADALGIGIAWAIAAVFL